MKSGIDKVCDFANEHRLTPGELMIMHSAAHTSSDWFVIVLYWSDKQFIDQGD